MNFRNFAPTAAFAAAALISTAFLAPLVTAPTARADGDGGEGESVFDKRCRVCHSATAGEHKTGPSLFAVFGRQAGSAGNFKRYKGLKDADWTWNEERRDAYLADPKKFVKTRTGNNSLMVLKLANEGEREDVIAYLKSPK